MHIYRRLFCGGITQLACAFRWVQIDRKGSQLIESE